MVGIYIDTPAYDEILEDRSAHFTDYISAIGGTFGLFTGFSIISAVEILYFFTKFILSLVRPSMKQY